jgi:hypothetical protein
MDFDDQSAIDFIKAFIQVLWADDRAPAKIYIQDANLPLILTMASDGQYQAAMQSESDMSKFVDYMVHLIDRSANMDF